MDRPAPNRLGRATLARLARQEGLPPIRILPWPIAVALLIGLSLVLGIITARLVVELVKALAGLLSNSVK